MRQEDVSQWVKDAQVAFGAATDLDSLKAARLAHCWRQGTYLSCFTRTWIFVA